MNKSSYVYINMCVCVSFSPSSSLTPSRSGSLTHAPLRWIIQHSSVATLSLWPRCQDFAWMSCARRGSVGRCTSTCYSKLLTNMLLFFGMYAKRQADHAMALPWALSRLGAVSDLRKRLSGLPLPGIEKPECFAPPTAEDRLDSSSSYFPSPPGPKPRRIERSSFLFFWASGQRLIGAGVFLPRLLRVSRLRSRLTSQPYLQRGALQWRMVLVLAEAAPL